MFQAKNMWRCQMPSCGYIYDPDRGDKKSKIPPGVLFEKLSRIWRCPVCRTSKRDFFEMGDREAVKMFKQAAGNSTPDQRAICYSFGERF